MHTYDQFNERKQFGDVALIHMIRNESAMLYRWESIKVVCNKFHGHVERIKVRKGCGETMVDYIRASLIRCTCQFDVLILMHSHLVCYMYDKEDNEDKDFSSCEASRKSNKVRLILNGAGVDEDGPLPSSAALTSRSIGNKKAKLSMTEAASSDIVQAMIDRCLADVSANLLIWGRKE
jgi:hypothetical protein